MNNNSTWLAASFVAILILLSVIGLAGSLWSLLLAWLAAYLCFPTYELLESKGIQRKHAAFLILLLILFIMCSILFVAMPYIVTEFTYFLKDMPHTIVTLLKKISPMFADYGINIQLEEGDLLKFFQANMPSISRSSFLWFGGAIKVAVFSIASTIINIISLFLFPVFFFYVSLYFSNINTVLKSWLPARYLPLCNRLIAHIDIVMANFVRGQLLVAIILGIYYTIALSILGLKFSIVIGCLTGILSIIPYVGFAIGLVSSILVAFATVYSYWMIFGVLAVFACAYLLDSFFLTPQIVGAKLGLNSLTVMLAIIIGGNLFGMWGMLFAIPIGGICKIILKTIEENYKKSSWFLAS
jgi:predicted PurR-regulated permease PerM